MFRIRPDKAFVAPGQFLGGELFEYELGFELTREELKVIELDEFGGDSKDVSIEDSISCSMFVLFCLIRRRLISNGALPDHVINGLILKWFEPGPLDRNISTTFGTRHPG